VWVLILPSLIGSLAYRKFLLNKKVRGEEFYHSAFKSVAAIIFLFIGTVIVPNCFHSNHSLTRVQNAFMFNESTCSVGAVMIAFLFDFLVIEIVIVSFYIIHFFRNFQHFFRG
jgi:L-asparagine transporter-like permease